MHYNKQKPLPSLPPTTPFGRIDPSNSRNREPLPKWRFDTFRARLLSLFKTSRMDNRRPVKPPLPAEVSRIPKPKRYGQIFTSPYFAHLKPGPTSTRTTQGTRSIPPSRDLHAIQNSPFTRPKPGCHSGVIRPQTAVSPHDTTSSNHHPESKTPPVPRHGILPPAPQTSSKYNRAPTTVPPVNWWRIGDEEHSYHDNALAATLALRPENRGPVIRRYSFSSTIGDLYFPPSHSVDVPCSVTSSVDYSNMSGAGLMRMSRGHEHVNMSLGLIMMGGEERTSVPADYRKSPTFSTHWL